MNAIESQQRQRGGRLSILPQDAAPKAGGTALYVLIAALLVAALTAWAQSPVLQCQALSFDDNVYLTSNRLVTHPGWPSTERFFSEVLTPSTVPGYYQPLAMVSLMLDYAAGGRPDHLRPFHRTGLIIHTINAALVVVLIFQLTHHIGAAALAGLLFGLHPAATEVLPWIAQRKTLLATLCSLGCLIAYLAWSRRRSRPWLAGSMLLYVLALLSKPTAVPLVVVLFVLDWWPLRRLDRRALIEKLPFIAIGVAAAIITVVSQSRSGGTVSTVDESLWRPFLIVAYTTSFYLRQLFWPVGWPGYYVFPEPFALNNPQVLGYVVASVVLIAVVVVSLKWTRACVASGMMYFALLFPTLGVIGFTDVIAANRFLYLPMIVLLIPICFLMAGQESTRTTSHRPKAFVRVIIVGIAACACIGEAMATQRAFVPWRDTVVLFDHLASVAPTAPKVRYNHANALSDAGRTEEAVREYEAAIALRPEYDQAHNNLAVELDGLGRRAEATEHFEKAIALNPSNARARNSYGAVLLRRGAWDEAIVQLQEAARLDPDLTDAPFNLGVAMMEKGDWMGAATAFELVVAQANNDSEALARLGYAYERLGRIDDAIQHYQRAAALDPTNKVAAERLKQLTQPETP